MGATIAERLKAHRPEVQRLLAEDEHKVGRAWVAHDRGDDSATIQRDLGVNAGHLATLRMQWTMLLDGQLPTAPSKRVLAGHKVRG